MTTWERIEVLAAGLRATGRYGDDAAEVVTDVLALAGVVDVHDIAGVSELAREYSVSRSTISNWADRYADFPARVTTVSAGPLYSRSAVRAWHDGRSWMAGTHRPAPPARP